MAEPVLTRAAARVERVAFLDELRNRVVRAGEAAGGVIERDFEIAGKVLRLRFAGPALIEALASSFEHARVPQVEAPDFVVDAWDGKSTGVGLPNRPWAADDYREHGAVRGWFDGELQISLRVGANAVSFLEPLRGRAVYWAPAAEELPYFERAAPLRALLQGWLAAEGLQLVHAAALGGSDGCVLIAGRGGSGKSSIALACLDTEVGHISDDFCVLQEGDPMTAHALYSSSKAHLDTLERMGVDPGWVANPDRPVGDKAILYLGRHQRERMISRAPLRAILVSTFTGRRDTRTVPISASVALAALAPSTVLTLPGTGAATMSRVASAARSVPCFRLEVGTDPAQVPSALLSVLGR